MKMYHKIIGLIYLLAFSTSFAESSTILETQFKSDLRTLMLNISPKLGSDYNRPQLTKEQLEEATTKSINRVSNRFPNRFITTVDEEAKLKNNQHIITQKDLATSIAKLKRVSTNSEFPAILEHYEKIELEFGLNPAQRLLAFRLSQDLIAKAERIEEIKETTSGEQDAAPNH